MEIKDLQDYVAIVNDWPKKGIVFKDITPLMNDGEAYRFATDKIVEYAKELKIDIIVGRKHVALLSAAQLLMR